MLGAQLLAQRTFPFSAGLAPLVGVGRPAGAEGIDEHAQHPLLEVGQVRVGIGRSRPTWHKVVWRALGES